MKRSHFYTPFLSECDYVKQNPSWQFEGDVGAMALPDPAGFCTDRQPLYRLYNDGQGGAPNHRFTTSSAIRDQMLQQGWIPEGLGTLGVAGYVPVG